MTLDGIELAELAGDDVRRVVGLAAQDTHIFDTTLRENLLLARRDASERRAAARASTGPGSGPGWTSLPPGSPPRSASAAPACPAASASGWASPGLCWPAFPC